MTLVTLGGLGDNATYKVRPGAWAALDLAPGSLEICADIKPRRTAQHLAELSEMTGHEVKYLKTCANYFRIDPSSEDSYRDLAEMCAMRRPSNQIVVWLSTAPALYADSLIEIRRHFPRGTVVVIEKPPGKDLASAVKLIALATLLFGAGGFHLVDHYLGKPALIEMMMKLSGAFFKASWNSNTIKEIHIHTDKKRGVEGRHAYFDEFGALLDVFQSHLLTTLAMLLCGPSDDLTDLSAKRGQFLASLPLITKRDVAVRTWRGQYDGFLREQGADPKSQAETAFAVSLQMPRIQLLSGIRCVLSAGKAMKVVGDDVAEIRVHYNDGRVVVKNLQEKVPGALPEHGMLLLAASAGRREFFVDPMESFAAFRITDAIRGEWAQNAVPLEIYRRNAVRSTDFTARMA